MDQTSVYNSGFAARVSAIPAAKAVRARIAAIDVVRGLIMFIMLFDHVRESIYAHVPLTDPLTVADTEPMLLITRMAAHFCAPLFVFLTGLGAWLYAHPASGPRDATGFLLKRGLFLVLLELVVVNTAWYGELPPSRLYLQVIWITGLAMIVLGLMHKLPMKVLLTVGLVIVAGHNTLGSVRFEQGTVAHAAWTLLMQRDVLWTGEAFQIKVTYPLLPWIGVILLGYCAGPLYARTMDPARRQRLMTMLGVAALFALAVLRGFNIYGENLPWEHGASAFLTVASFFNFTKYPPSLDFLLMTLGICMLVLPRLEAFDNAFTRVCATLGSVPMFFYLLHLYVLLVMQKSLVWLFGATHGDRFGVGQYWLVWVVALALMPLLYLPCRVFARYKRASTQAWVRYF
ncbi:MAG TPA: heparan-alpha-glucosaminide N-acetyltransferase domain-containing protein [Duganella sp.]|nr:heparan-alpha-glucosaminide N-acetyltransferase domain-containing protein [Duganella sp.]